MQKISDILNPAPMPEGREMPQTTDFTDDRDFRTQLQQFLDDLQHGATFWSFRHHQHYVNPGLYVKDYGRVGLPLAARDAENIARLCNQSPFGRGSETVVDTSVRKTWELNAGNFECQNPLWHAKLEQLLLEVLEALGVGVQTRMDPYKMLLYEEGAFFKPHKDSEKTPGMFATVVVCLPSEHLGGEVRLVHGKETRILETSPTSNFDLTVLSWYSDVSHEVRPITSGYRLVLTYNLVQDRSAPIQSANALDNKHIELQSLLGSWSRMDRDSCSSFYLYPLSHEYTAANLSQRTLKGPDAMKAKYLNQACSAGGVYWFIGTLEKSKTEDDFYDAYDCPDDNYTLITSVFTPNGTPIDLSLEVEEEDHMLADDYYDGRSPDSEDGGEYTGNEGVVSTLHYRDTVFIMMRKDCIVDQVSKINSPGTLRYLFELVRDDPPESLSLRKRTILGIMIRVLECVKSALKAVEFKELFIDISKICHSMGEKQAVWEALEPFLRNGGWKRSDHFTQIVANEASKDASHGIADAWDKWFGPLPTSISYKNVYLVHNALRRVRDTLPSAVVPAFEEWETRRLENMLRTVQTFTKEDTDPLWLLMTNIPQHTYHEVVVPKVASGNKKSLALFLHHIASKMFKIDGDDFPSWEPIVVDTFRKILPASTLRISTQELAADTYRRRPEFLDDFLDTLHDALEMGIGEEATQMLKLGLPQFPDKFSPFWKNWSSILRFFKSLLLNIKNCDPEEDLERTVVFSTRLVIETSADALALRCPIAPTTWAREVTVSCSCGPCQRLNQFLRNPQQSTQRFSYAQGIRDHLRNRLVMGDYIFNTEKQGTPYTLVIQKTNDAYHRSLKEWKAEKREMLDSVKVLFRAHHIMREILGNGYEQEIERRITGGAPPTASNTLRPTNAARPNAQAPPPVAGVKRKLDIVDLTDDGSD